MAAPPGRRDAPPHQRFYLVKAPRQVDDGLVVKAELLPFQGAAQLGLGLEVGDRPAADLGVEDLGVTSTVLLGTVHGRAGVAHQGFGVRGRILSERDAHRRRGVDLPARWPIEHERRGEDALDPQRQRHRLSLPLERLAKHHELVSAEPGDGVGRPEDIPDALGQLDEEVIAGAVAEAVVHVLEAVYVYEEHCQQTCHPTEPADRAGEAVEQQCAVGEPGERVEKGVADELALVGLALGKVAHEEAPERQPVVLHTDRRNFRREMAAVARVDLHLSSYLCALGPAVPCAPGSTSENISERAVASPLQNPFDEALADDLVTEPAEHRFCGGVPVGDYA